MRGVAIYVKYIVIPTIAVLAVAWMVYVGRKAVKRITDRRDKKNRR
jgi:NADH:ubiquinone oxidoreductase subunit H